MAVTQDGMTRRRFGKAALALAATGLLASCASMIGPRRIELLQARLQAGLERRFPLRNRMLQLFDVQLTRPRLAILSETDRVGLTLDVHVAPPFMRQSWDGTLALSGHLVLDNARNAVVLSATHVDRFDVDGMDSDRVRELGRAADVLVNQLLRDMPVYSFHPEDLRYAGVQFLPTRLETAPGALFVTLEPAR
ncbi:DUF1439 domain-containing protein [Massilia pinisoli]|uniref:DUF1439 domain-containing protein n=1 Tax=Massilia pinisoli TaxID=1772194 RepID=A0ABT1ZZ72_9BURK|nr:DUF1439 domain-containing protein [Massilia pinisoli]MCS0584929.1 DUF1439 domain-containing protein [Massilia pinisoli]